MASAAIRISGSNTNQWVSLKTKYFKTLHITNINAPNQEPQQEVANVTVNVSGNVMSQDYVEGELAEQIKDAVRRGADFGVI